MLGFAPFGSWLFGGSSAPSSGGAPASTVTGVSVSPATSAVVNGGSQHYTANVTGTGEFDSTVAWSISGSGAIDASGNATGATGSYTVTATTTQGGLTATASFTVLAPGAATPFPDLCVSTIMRQSTANLTSNLTSAINLTASLL